MGRARRRRRRFRRVIRLALFMALFFGVLPGLLATSATGHPLTGLFIIPAAMLGTMLVLPFLLLALVVTVAAVALPFAILAVIFGVPFYLVYRLAAGSRTRPRRVDDEDDEDDRLPADVQLRRRYVAGEITYAQFQEGMLGLLKERYARGTLQLAEYEAELEKLVAPARRVDVKRDPTVSGAPRLN
jgi:uncharacterized membrane protein